jgi:UDP-glucose 4-epimerase
MRVVVTGGLGFIGSHLCERLVDDGHDVLIVDDRRTCVVHEIAGADLWPVAIAEAGDVGPCDVVFHLASPVGPLGVIDWRGRIAREVVADASSVATWATRAGAVLVDVSTSEVYGSGHADKEEDACTFQPGVSARKEYAVAKLAAETMLRNIDGLDVRVVRPFNVAGPRQRSEGGFVLPRFLEQAAAAEPLTVYQPGTQRRAFAHVADIGDGLVAVAGWGRRGQVYNLGNVGNACSILDLAHEVLAITGSPAGFVIVDPRELHGPDFAEAPDKLPDARKAARELGWHPRRDRAMCIRDAIGARS